MAAKKVALMVGFVPIATRIDPAVDEESSGAHAVCTGTDGAPHAPARVKQTVGCTSCDRTHSSVFGFTQRGVERGDQLVVLTADEIAGAAGAPRTGRAGQPPIEIVFHPREKVFAATVAGDSVQNVYPDKGAEKAYTLLRDTLAAHPDVVACMIWAPTSKNALWTLEVVGERIVATKRAWPESVRATVSIPQVDVLDMERQMFDQLVVDTVTDFDLGRYVDQAKLGLADLIASRTGTAPAAVTGLPGAAPLDLLAQIQQSLAATQPSKPKAVKRAPAKRAAKKTAAKRTTTKKEVAA